MAKGKGGSSALVNAYLLLYNFACCFGWLYVLIISIKNIKNNTLDNHWVEVQQVLKVVQTAACLEVVHSMVGLVKSPWITALMQVFSRVWTLWAVMDVAPTAQSSIFFTFACTSWALVEVPRYFFYALNILDAVPYALFWLRYSLFAVLYPTGITGELGCMYMAVLYLKGDLALNELTKLPPTTLLLLGLIVFVVLTYIPGSPKMYGHMLATRKKQFAALKKESEEKKK